MSDSDQINLVTLNAAAKKLADGYREAARKASAQARMFEPGTHDRSAGMRRANKLAELAERMDRLANPKLSR